MKDDLKWKVQVAEVSVQLQSGWNSGHPDTVIKDYDIYIYEYLVMMCYDSMIKQSFFDIYLHDLHVQINVFFIHLCLFFFKVHVVLFPLRSPVRTLAVQCSSSPFRVNRALFRLWVPTCWYVMLNRLRKCPIWQGMIWSFQLQLEWFSVVSSFKLRTETSYTYTYTYITSSFPPVLEPPTCYSLHGFLAVRASTTRIEPPVCWLSSCQGETLTVTASLRR